MQFYRICGSLSNDLRFLSNDPRLAASPFSAGRYSGSICHVGSFATASR